MVEYSLTVNAINDLINLKENDEDDEVQKMSVQKQKEDI